MTTAKEGRRANRDKALRLTAGDPRKKVDASSWTPPEALNGGRKTGARPIRPRIYKFGGKIQGDRADRHPGRAPRASGGRTGTGSLSMANVPQENMDEFGSYHQGGYKRGGAPKAGQDMAAMKKGLHSNSSARTPAANGGTYFGGTRPTGGRLAKCDGGPAEKARGGSSGYSKDAVDKEIRKDKRIGKKEAANIHRLLKGRTDAPYNPPPEFGAGNSATADDRSRLRGMLGGGDDEGQKRGGRTKHARGGRTKGKTNIKIVINAKPDQPPQMPPQGPVRPPPPPMPPPQMPPPAGGPPPGMAGPPGAGGLPPGGPMPRKSGGRTYRSAKDMDAGAESGLGRLEKTEIAAHHR